MKSHKIIDGVRYNFEVWMMEPLEDVYRFGIQGWPLRGNPFSYSMRLPKKFIEDEIDADNNKETLEQIAFNVVDSHLHDLLTLSHGEVIANLEAWFLEAKQKESNK